MLAKGESARQQISQATVVAWLNGCLVVWLFSCLVVWLSGCLVVWLFSCLVVLLSVWKTVPSEARVTPH